MALPPTSTKGSGDSTPVTTFEIDAPNIPITHSGTVATIGTIPIAGGGTGQVTKAAAFDALSPMTTSGDTIYGGASGTGTRLPKGTDGQVLTLASGIPSWAAVTASSTTSKKLGYDHTTGDNVAAGANDIQLVRVYAPTTSVISRMGVFLAANAGGKKVVIGIYDQDNATGLPNNKLGQTSEYTTAVPNGASADGGYRTLSLLATVNITADTPYWLAVHSDSAASYDNAFNSVTTGGQKYKTVTYNATMPATIVTVTGDAGAGVSIGGF